MDWLELTVKIPAPRAAEAEDIATDIVPYGLYLEDYSDLEEGAREIAHIDLIDETLLARDRETAVIHLYLDPDGDTEEVRQMLTARLGAAGIPCEFGTSLVKEEEWKDNWKRFFHTTPIGDRLVIRPTWEPMPDDPARAVLSIDPGAAFGTGTHATTRMCLEMIERHLRPGDTLLDLGCGSGILSIAGALLGAAKAVGSDLDPVAVKVATENAALNGVSDRAEYRTGDLTETVQGRFRVVCANIVADVIMTLARTVSDYMTEDGIFLCSGILDTRAEEVAAALSAAGLTVIETHTESPWYAYAAVRNKK